MKISIITTVYQAEKDLPRLLDSMMAIKSKEVEFFLIDNGSTDRSNEICQDYAARDSRFVILRLEENIGYIRARNLGLDIIEADYIGFSDSDDYLDSEGYDKAINYIKQYNCDFFVGSWFRESPTLSSKHNCGLDEGFYQKEDLSKILPRFFGIVEGKSIFPGFEWKQLIRKKIIDKNHIRFDETLKPTEDLIFNANLIRLVQSLYVSDQPLYHYVINDNSITSTTLSNFNFESYYFRDRNLYKSFISISNEKICNQAVSNLSLMTFLSFLSISVKNNGLNATILLLNQIVDKSKIASEINESSTWNFFSKLAKFLVKRHCYFPILLFAKIRNLHDKD